MNMRSIINLLTFSALLLLGGWAHAAGSHKSSAILMTDYEVMDWNGGALIVGTLSGAAEIYGSQSSAMPNGSVMINCGVRILRGGSDLDLISNCVQKDLSGDEFYTVAERKAGTLDTGGGGDGIQTIVGGTGKYQGVTGKCTYTVQFLESPWITVETSCTTD
ncbi:MAG: hypothetical protein CBB82_00775 [Betaproteobacteria bacterium TMED22]|nr:MAG: hypothetical protein CBB82_00775 [Betaproteobacteria bacterium TMED22]|tara:strand:- start:24873 stop:25358 length:486 start_codon:yes stop_codon:yes gene_type:complete